MAAEEGALAAATAWSAANPPSTSSIEIPNQVRPPPLEHKQHRHHSNPTPHPPQGKSASDKTIRIKMCGEPVSVGVPDTADEFFMVETSSGQTHVRNLVSDLR